MSNKGYLPALMAHVVRGVRSNAGSKGTERIIANTQGLTLTMHCAMEDGIQLGRELKCYEP